MEQAEEIRDGVTKHVERKMFPGYVLVRMVMNDDTWFVIRNTRGVTGFVGPGSKPVPLTETEMRALGIRARRRKRFPSISLRATAWLSLPVCGRT